MAATRYHLLQAATGIELPGSSDRKCFSRRCVMHSEVHRVQMNVAPPFA
jgi:hypothetical protein